MTINPYESPKVQPGYGVELTSVAFPFIIGAFAICNTFVATEVGFVLSVALGLGQHFWELTEANFWFAALRGAFVSAVSLVPVLIVVFRANRRRQLVLGIAAPILIAAVTSVCF